MTGDDPDGAIAAFVAAAGFSLAAIAECVRFADEPREQTALAELAAAGTKRATAALHRSYETEAQRLPRAGDVFVVLDGAGAPRCICRTESVEIVAFRDVDDAFAFEEGEGDRTLSAWRAIHTRFFEEEARANGFAFTPDARVVLQRFERIA